MDTPYSTTPKAQETIAALWRLEEVILNTLDFSEVAQKIVDSVLVELGYLQKGYRVIVLALIDEETQMLRRISYSRTKEAERAIGSLSKPFPQIAIPLAETKNVCIQAIESRHPQVTQHVADVFYPAFSREEIDPIQEVVGIKTTMVYPILAKGKSLGVLIFSLIKEAQEVSQEEKDLLAGFTDVVGVAVQNARLYSSLAQTTDQLAQANQRLSEALTKLKELDHLKDEFLAYASHELRTPLTSVRGYASLLEKDLAGKLTDKQRTYFHVIEESSERVIKLVGNLLDVSRIQAGRFEIDPKPTDLMQLSQTAIAEILPTAQEHHLTIMVQPPSSPLPLVLTDSDKIKEVLINLLSNATKFTPSGGSITVSFTQQNGMVTTTVTDTGRGVKPEDKQYLFQEYGMIKKSYLVMQENQGTGLGLYISRSIVRLHGGEMTLASEGENKGTTVSFSLKVAK